jgi:hypothetical protein
VILKPMCLNEVLANLESGNYSSEKECFADIYLIWDNCMQYNTEDSTIYQTAKCLVDITKGKEEEYYKLEEAYVQVDNEVNEVKEADKSTTEKSKKKKLMPRKSLKYRGKENPLDEKTTEGQENKNSSPLVDTKSNSKLNNNTVLKETAVYEANDDTPQE